MAFGDSWLISVMMRFTSNGSRIMSELSAATNAANRALDLQTGKISRATAAMDAFRASALRATGAIAGWGALTGAALGGFAVDQAANLERQMKLFQMATGFSPRQMDSIYRQVYRTGAATAQPAGTVGAEFVGITQMGLPPQLMTPQFLDQMTKFGDVINLQTRGQIQAVDAIKIAISSAHQLGLYSTQGIESLATSLMKTSFILPHGLTRFATQSKYFAPWLRTFGDSPESINQLMSLSWMLDVSGLSTGRGGTSIQAMIRNMNVALQLTKHNETGRRALLQQMGLLRPDGTPVAVTLDKQGRPYLSADVFTDRLAQFVQGRTAGLHGEALIRARANIANMLQGAFGTQGGLFASILSNTGVQQLKMFHERFAKTPRGIDEAQAQVLDTFWGSLQKATSAVQNFGAAMGSPALKNLEALLNKVAGGFNRLTGWAVANPASAGTAAVAFGTTTAALAGIWVITKVFGVIEGFVKLLGRSEPAFGKAVVTAGRFTAKFSAAEEAFSRVLGPLGIFVSIISELADDVKMFKDWQAKGGLSFLDVLKGASLGVGGPLAPLVRYGIDQIQNHLTVTVVDRTGGGVKMKSVLRSHGQLFGSPSSPGVLNLASPSLGLSP